MRVCGPQGLPQRPPEDGPHLIVIPVASLVAKMELLPSMMRFEFSFPAIDDEL